MPPAARCTQGGRPRSSGGPRADTRATTPSTASAGVTTARVRTAWPGTSSAQPSAGAKTTTGSSSSSAVEPLDIRVAVAATTTRGGPTPATRRGSPSVWSSRTTVRPVVAGSASGAPSRAHERAAAVAAASTSAARAAVTTRSRADGRPRDSTPAAVAAVPATAVSTGQEVSGAARVVAHTTTAAGTSRTSVHVQRWSTSAGEPLTR